MTQSEQRRVLAQYVAGLRSLCAEVSAATTALSRNDLSDFEVRLEAQQSICQQLATLAPMPGLLASPEAESQISNQASLSSLRAELRQAQQELARLTRIFQSLLKRSEQTTSLLSLLCQSYTEGYGRTASAPTACRVSCEV